MSEASKRRGWHAEDEPITDDLAIAAAYAVAPPPPKTTSKEAIDHDDDDSNEIELDETSSNDDDQKMPANDEPGDESTDNIIPSTEQSNEPNKANDNDSNKNNDDDDDESDVDLTEALQQMDADENDVDGMDKQQQGESLIPKTQNEIDPYHAKIQQLEAILGTSLSVEEREQLKLKTKQVNLLPAGTIQHHMIDDRIIVVQSESGLLLEEGNILVLKHETEGWIPLGKVFEVFGPVSQPMYSIRLPPSPQDQVDNGNGKQEQSSTANAMSTTDPWAKDGEYTQLLQGTRQSAFYIKDDAIFIDTQRVYMSSGRGCDASNVHDEEVNNPNEMYYSDDEKERQAKGKGGKGRNNRNHTKGPGRNRPNGGAVPQNFQQPYAAPAAGLPQGFHSSRPGGFQQPVVGSPFPPSYPRAPNQASSNQNSASAPEESDTIYYD